MAAPYFGPDSGAREKSHALHILADAGQLPGPASGEEEVRLMALTNAQQLVADLEALDALFATPETWVKGVLARCERDDRVDEMSPRADKWCLSGAVNRICGVSAADINIVRKVFLRRERLQNALFAALPKTRQISSQYKASSVISYNDSPLTTFTAIKRTIRRALRSARAALEGAA